MASSAVSGHAALMAIVKSGDSPPTFTDIAEVKGRIARPKEMKETKEITYHGSTLDEYIISPVLKRETVSLAGNFIDNNATHDESTGLQALLRAGTKFAARFKGPNYSSGVRDDFIFSCFCVDFEPGAGEGADEYDFACTLRPTGAYNHNGTEVTP